MKPSLEGNILHLTKLHEFLYFNAAGHNMLLAHAKAWHTYDKEFRKTQQGRVSIVVNAQWFEPKTDREEDIKAADRGMQWFLGWMAHPVFVDGDYPQVMKTRIMEKSKAQGLSSRFVICNFIKPVKKIQGDVFLFN